MFTGTVSPAMFEWVLPGDQWDFQRLGDWIQSPVFSQLDSSWNMSLNLKINEWIWIYLCRRDNGAPKIITYRIQMKGKTFVKEITATSSFDKKNAFRAKPMILKKELPSNSKLIITCYMKGYTPHPIAGDIVPCAAQTKVANSVIEMENPKDNDWSSFDIKGDIVPCATQTKIANSVIEKENPKDNEWSSLDMKDDALLRQRMKELLTKGSDHDVTIFVQDKEFRAHRSILSTRSPVFAKMFAQDTKETNTGTISIEDCDPESFDQFLVYVYCGRTQNLSPSNALQLYYTADNYDFPVLKERCVSLLKTSLSVEFICDVVLLAAKHQEKELLKVATEFFAWNMKKILVTVGWKNFLLQNPDEANELYIKSMEILLPKN